MENKQNIKLKELHEKLNSHIEEQNKNWESFVYAKQKKFYQGLEEIEIDGCRSSEIRYERYAIDKYLSKEKTALDIGCNCGFFTIYVSNMLKHIEGVEINPYLIKIAKDTKVFLQKNNVDFFATSFEKFETGKKYDVIFSLANDETIDGNTKFTFKEYVEKICKLMKNDGYLIFETVSTDTYAPKLFKPKLKHLTNLFEVLEDRMVKSEYPLNVPERRFLVMKLKN